MAISERQQLFLLRRNFITRFFENDLLGSDVDLRQSLVWVVAGLMTPGLLINIGAMDSFQGLYSAGGVAEVQIASVVVKALLLGFAMVGMGMITVVVWDSLLVDRRDCHILGALPVRSRTVLAAKMLALGHFWLVMTVAINAVPVVLFGLVAGAFVGIPRAFVAHAASVALASAFMFLGVLAVQGALVGLLGGALYRRASALLQLVFAAALFFGFLLLPYFAWTIAAAVRPGRGLGWTIAVPIVWFVALEEALLGLVWPRLAGLATVAAVAMSAVTAVATLAYGLGYRRHIRRTLESHDLSHGASMGLGLARALSGRAARWWLRLPAARGLAGFVFATVARSARHRLGLFFALGLGVAVTMTGLPRVLNRPGGLETPSIDLLSIPLVLIFALTCGLKYLFKIPSEIAARWIFELAEPAAASWLAGARRALVALGVVLPIVVTAPWFWWLWGAGVAALHGAVCVALGLLIVELWMIEVVRVPFATTYLTGQSRMRFLWPLYMQAFLFFAYGTVRIERALANHPAIVLTICAAVVAVAIELRRRHPARVTRRRLEAFDEQPDRPQELGLAQVVRL